MVFPFLFLEFEAILLEKFPENKDNIRPTFKNIYLLYTTKNLLPILFQLKSQLQID